MNITGKTNKVALVIGSGGIKCAASVGLWEVLQREEIKEDLVISCSGGANLLFKKMVEAQTRPEVG